MKFYFTLSDATHQWKNFKRWMKALPVLRKLHSGSGKAGRNRIGADEEYGPKVFPKFGVVSPISDKNVAAKVAHVGELLAKEFEDRIKRMLELQQADWVPLASSYMKYKVRNRLDTRILIATGTYLSLISARQISSGLWTVDVPAVPLPDGSGHTYRDLAYWLEYGTVKMPPRPHWRLVARQMANRPKELAKVYSIEVDEIENAYFMSLAKSLGV